MTGQQRLTQRKSCSSCNKVKPTHDFAPLKRFDFSLEADHRKDVCRDCEIILGDAMNPFLEEQQLTIRQEQEAGDE